MTIDHMPIRMLVDHANVMLAGLTAGGNWRPAQDPKKWVEADTDVPVPDAAWIENRDNDALFVAAAPGLVRALLGAVQTIRVDVRVQLPTVVDHVVVNIPTSPPACDEAGG